ncbi:anti-sigma B factor antagonist [Nonomuraea polychroma]|uniref:Anti-sigma factor antagonist n=1 Tax=Nonomuraea polychroma TaxID=46176 RepID=A0A438MAD3_9ACTN|nr:STAS domain-containing protein [Nonomuraea polychroma]RVX42689.1 anti-sigma B factor antagonist [Nonomuraea polychroma]
MSDTRLALRVDDHEGISVLHLDGELDLATEHIFLRACDQLLARGHAKIVVDVSRLGFCDCTGLGAFIAVQQQAELWGGYLRLVGVRRQLAKLLRLAQLVDTFPPYTDLQHACG